MDLGIFRISSIFSWTGCNLTFLLVIMKYTPMAVYDNILFKIFHPIVIVFRLHLYQAPNRSSSASTLKWIAKGVGIALSKIGLALDIFSVENRFQSCKVIPEWVIGDRGGQQFEHRWWFIRTASIWLTRRHRNDSYLRDKQACPLWPQ